MKFIDNDSLKDRLVLSVKGTYSDHLFFMNAKYDDGIQESGKWYLKRDTLVLYHKEIIHVEKANGQWIGVEEMDTVKYLLNADSLGFYKNEKKFRKISK